MEQKKKHLFHLVDYSPWPLFVSLGAFFFTMFIVLTTERIELSSVFVYINFLILLICAYKWWGDVIKEPSYKKNKKQAYNKISKKYYCKGNITKISSSTNVPISLRNHSLKKKGTIKKLKENKEMEQDINASNIKICVHLSYFNNTNVLKLFKKYVIENKLQSKNLKDLTQVEQTKFCNIINDVIESHILIYCIGLNAIYRVYITHFKKGIYYYEKDINTVDTVEFDSSLNISPIEVYDKKEVSKINDNYDFDTGLNKSSKYILKGLSKFKEKHNLQNEADLKKHIVKGYFFEYTSIDDKKIIDSAD